MRAFAVTILCSIGLVACGGGGRLEPIPLAESKYKLMGNGEEKLLRAANDHCTSQKKKINVVLSLSTEVTYFCLGPGETVTYPNSSPGRAGGRSLDCVGLNDGDLTTMHCD
jgi:hypothetical protein